MFKGTVAAVAASTAAAWGDIGFGLDDVASPASIGSFGLNDVASPSIGGPVGADYVTKDDSYGSLSGIGGIGSRIGGIRGTIGGLGKLGAGYGKGLGLSGLGHGISGLSSIGSGYGSRSLGYGKSLGGYGKSLGYKTASLKAPVYKAPVYKAPVYKAPKYKAPTYITPKYSSPVSPRVTGKTIAHKQPVSWGPYSYRRPRVSYSVDQPVPYLGVQGPRTNFGIKRPDFDIATKTGHLSKIGPVLANSFRRPQMAAVAPQFDFQAPKLSFQGGRASTHAPIQKYQGPQIKQVWKAPVTGLDAPKVATDLDGPQGSFAVKKPVENNYVVGPKTHYAQEAPKVKVDGGYGSYTQYAVKPVHSYGYAPKQTQAFDISYDKGYGYAQGY